MAQASQTPGIYISVPFCRAKCSFCNFASGVSSAEAIEAYLQRLSEEIATARARAVQRGLALANVIGSVYLGGGTPSLLSPAQMREMFSNLRHTFELCAEAEVTLEAAPGQIAEDVLQAAIECGVNRVSLGVQSFVDREAQAVGRSHTGESCLAEIARLRSAGIADVGADLICGLPYQTPESFALSLNAAANSGATHLSVYMLEVDDKSRLGREVLGGGARLHAPAVPDEDAVARMYELACDHLPACGYEQYEISNFARPGFQSAHNRRYWDRTPYLGFGLDAHSMLPVDATGTECVRWQNTGDLAGYTMGRDEPELNRVNLREAFEEEVFLGLRLAEGLSADRLRRYPTVWSETFASRAEPLLGDGLMQRSRDGWRLTQAGRVVSSEIFGELLCEEPALV